VPKRIYSPTIGLCIKEGGKVIPKPQTHFNEAKLTAIALAVRFACLPKVVEDGGFMALDDVVTTGATIIACAKELSKAGGVRISILSLGLAKS